MSQRRVLITGAGSGLGRALARRYARAGDAVACADIRLDRAEETVAELSGTAHFACLVDIAEDASMAALREQIAARWDAVDVLINNAGVASGGNLLDAPMSEWQWMLNLNVLGVVRGCREFLPGMIARGQGQVINVASFAALAGAPGLMTYGVAKAAVYTLSEQLRAEMALQNSGVRVSVLCPSFFKTNLTENFRGSERVKGLASKLMERAHESADDIAAYTFDAAERGEPLIIPTRAERMRWRIRRWLPAWYFRKLVQGFAARMRGPQE
jgi:NADP-dependent 3-hydroxy acid dehydrogenase YdfG